MTDAEAIHSDFGNEIVAVICNEKITNDMQYISAHKSKITGTITRGLCHFMYECDMGLHWKKLIESEIILQL